MSRAKVLLSDVVIATLNAIEFNRNRGRYAPCNLIVPFLNQTGIVRSKSGNQNVKC